MLKQKASVVELILPNTADTVSPTTLSMWMLWYRPSFSYICF